MTARLPRKFDALLRCSGKARGHRPRLQLRPFVGRLGWLGAGASPSITTVTQSGTYYLEPYETPGSGGAKALKILREHDPVNANNVWYYIECRRSLGDFDSAAFSGIHYSQDVNNVLGGVVVHLGIDKNWDYYPYGKGPNVRPP